MSAVPEDHPQLFDLAEDKARQCLYPMVEGVTGYAYGCRCPRCSGAKRSYREPKRGSECMTEGCTAPREKWRQHCAGHRVRTLGRRARAAPCELCGREHVWYECQVEQFRPEIQDLYRRTCGFCRRGYIGVIKRHHLDTDWALRLIDAQHCELCGHAFKMGGNGKTLKMIDHDHACPGDCRLHSCGLCLRGIICPACNTHIGGVEALVRWVGLDRIGRYLGVDDGG